MITQHGMVHTYIKWGVTVIVVVILLVPVYFLFSLRLTLFTNSDTIFACDSIVDPKTTPTAGAGTGAPLRRLGDYYDPRTKTWHCSGGGGGDATSCDGGSDGGGLPRTQRIPPSPPITPGTINAFAVFTTIPDVLAHAINWRSIKQQGVIFYLRRNFILNSMAHIYKVTQMEPQHKQVHPTRIMQSLFILIPMLPIRAMRHIFTAIKMRLMPVGQREISFQ